MVLLIPFEQFWGAGVTVTVTVGVSVRVGVGVDVGGGAGIAAWPFGWAGCTVLAMPGETMTSINVSTPMAKAAALSREKRSNPVSLFLSILVTPSDQLCYCSWSPLIGQTSTTRGREPFG
jgi:hypothetical protein